VIDTEAAQDRRLHIVYVDRIGDDVIAKSSVWPITAPRFIPPPANHMVKQRGWWSRP